MVEDKLGSRKLTAALKGEHVHQGKGGTYTEPCAGIVYDPRRETIEQARTRARAGAVGA